MCTAKMDERKAAIKLSLIGAHFLKCWRRPRSCFRPMSCRSYLSVSVAADAGNYAYTGSSRSRRPDGIGQRLAYLGIGTVD
jgi:hypothetical protein